MSQMRKRPLPEGTPNGSTRSILLKKSLAADDALLIPLFTANSGAHAMDMGERRVMQEALLL